jgi:[ribosomal protein S18]-alanine N-acetyltransferase
VYRIDPMTQEDVAEVGRVERRCFSNPWPISAYRRELQAPDQNYYVVVRDAPPNAPLLPATTPKGAGLAAAHGNGHDPSPGGTRAVPRRTLLPLGLARRLESNGAGASRRPLPPVLGFAGMWVLYDEAHITTIGVEPGYRGRGLGELLLVAMFDESLRRNATWLTLEVRVSNAPAQALYAKYGFAVQGVRKRYYSDNNEDAHIMWSRSLQDSDYRAEVAALRQTLFARLELSAVGSAGPAPNGLHRSPDG